MSGHNTCSKNVATHPGLVDALNKIIRSKVYQRIWWSYYQGKNTILYSDYIVTRTYKAKQEQFNVPHHLFVLTLKIYIYISIQLTTEEIKLQLRGRRLFKRFCYIKHLLSAHEDRLVSCCSSTTQSIRFSVAIFTIFTFIICFF